MPLLSLGEVLADLVCEQPADGLTDATAFVPHFGGAGLQHAGWDPAAPSIGDALADAAEAGARATESWGAIG